MDVDSAAEMKAALDARFDACDLLVMTAAVADFRPADEHEHKLHKSEMGDSPALLLERTDDILAGLAARRAHQVVVGFAMETEDLVASARDKLDRKNTW